jgi:hypothetical protein
MKGHNLPPKDHIIRIVPYGRLAKDAEGNPIGLTAAAFQRKETEEGLSVTWREYFAGTEYERFIRAVRAIRASKFPPGKRAGYAVGEVEAVATACARRGHKVRIIHMPEDDNKAHAEIRQMPREDDILLEDLATNSWCKLVLEATLPEGKEAAPDEEASRSALL